MKGIIFFYVNYHPDKGEKSEDYFNIIRTENKDLISVIKKMDYEVGFIPVTNEASRIEKLDFESNLITSSLGEQ